MTVADVPTPGVNRLTERLLAQDVKREDPSTWPEGVWMCDTVNFAYSREWRYTPTWESPCGLLLKRHGDFWGDTWVEGEYKCEENDNPLFACPRMWERCEHRKRLPQGMNCQWHRTDRVWTEEESAERLYESHTREAKRLWEEDFGKYPGWKGICPNLKTVQDDGRMVRKCRYSVSECISSHCDSTQCVCRLGAERDLSKANIYYDLYVERHWTEGFLHREEKQLLKGLKLFGSPVARTDAEISLRIWRHDPDNITLPHNFTRLNAMWQSESSKDLSREAFFVRHHGKWQERTDCTMRIEVRNIRVARNEQRDILQDLQDVAAGLEVVHDSDNAKAAKARKTESRSRAKVEKLAKLLANDMLKGKPGLATIQMRDMKQDMRDRVRAEAERIVARVREKQDRIERERAQVSLFDLSDK